MGNRLSLRAACIVSVLVICSGAAFPQQGVVDLDGRAVDPFAEHSSKIVVLIFVRRDCPISGRYAPSIQQISKRYADRAGFWLVYPDRSETSSEIRRSVLEFGYHLPVLRDPERALVKLSHVQITPEAAVFDRNHRLIYDGRIDDWYVDVTRARPAPTTHELEDAIHAASTGEAVAKSEVRGVGCYISDLP
jgi:AhpC/TSA family